MHTAQAGMVFMGSSGGSLGEPPRGTSIWEDFRDSMRELATDQVAAAIANGAFDKVDAQRIGRIQGDVPLSPSPSPLNTPRSPLDPLVLLHDRLCRNRQVQLLMVVGLSKFWHAWLHVVIAIRNAHSLLV